MGAKTSIEWVRNDDGTPGSTWNLVYGCTKVSPGCDHCYIERTPPFRMAGMKFDRPGIGGNIPLVFHDQRMYDPLRKTKPGRWFVNSLSDMFHKDVPAEFIARAFAVMRLAEHQVFQVLTKRPARMQSLLNSDRFRTMVADATNEVVADSDAPLTKKARYFAASRPVPFDWPIRNLHLGVTVENQDQANKRIPKLLMTPAAVRFLSMEPLLSGVDLTRVQWTKGGGSHLDVVNGKHGIPGAWQAKAKKVDWVIVGGESGPKARPMHPQWAADLRDQCVDAGVPYLFKQWGEWAPVAPDSVRAGDALLHVSGAAVALEHDEIPPLLTVAQRRQAYAMRKVGKKNAGRELEGRTWDEFPA